MLDKDNNFNVKIQDLLLEKERIVKELNELLKQYKGIEIEIEQLENAEFIRTGIFKLSTEITIKINEFDLLKELIKETEGQNIKPDKPNQN